MLDLALAADLAVAAAEPAGPATPEDAAAAQERMARMSVEAGNRGWVAVFAPLAAYAVLGFGAYAAGITAGLAGAWYALQALAQTLLGGGATP